MFIIYYYCACVRGVVLLDLSVFSGWNQTTIIMFGLLHQFMTVVCDCCVGLLWAVMGVMVFTLQP